jgi:hypothetical protein
LKRLSLNWKEIYHEGTSKNRSYSSDATKLSANDSASFPFRFMDAHARAARDPHREQFFEVPMTVITTTLVLENLLQNVQWSYGGDDSRATILWYWANWNKA